MERPWSSLAGTNRDIVVIDGDVSSSTKTDIFARAYPDRFFNLGIAEQNMVDVAAGLALSGKIPFVSTFSIFGCGRAWEQIRNTVALDNLNVKLVMTHAGLSLGGDGATHQGLEDIAVMRVIPNMRVIIPADASEVRSVVRYAVDHPGPVYIRLSRRRTMVLFGENYEYDPREYPIIRDGDDVAIFASGCMIREALIASEQLRKGGHLREGHRHAYRETPREGLHPQQRSRDRPRRLGGGAQRLRRRGKRPRRTACRGVPRPDETGRCPGPARRSGQVDELFDLLGISSRYISEAVHTLIRTERR